MYVWIRNCIDTSGRCLLLGSRTTLGRGILLALSDAKRQVRRHNDNDAKVANHPSRVER